MIVSYHELRKIAPFKAREVARKVLMHMNGNVAEAARILGISRPTVRRARDGIIAPDDHRHLRRRQALILSASLLGKQKGRTSGIGD